MRFPIVTSSARSSPRAWPRAQGGPGSRVGVAADVIRSRGGHVLEVELWRRHRGEHLVEDRVRTHLFGQRLVREDEAVPERVADERLQVVDDGVLAPADQRERPRALDEADRPARAGAVRDVLRESGRPWAAGSRVAVAMSTA